MINKKPTHYYLALKGIIIIPIVATLMVRCSLNNDEHIPCYYSGTSGDEKFIPIGDYRNSDAPKTDLSKLKDKDLIITRLKYNNNASMYCITTIHKVNNILEEHKDFAAGTINDYDKAIYKWVNDTTITFKLINSSNNKSESFRMSGNGNRSALERK